MARSFMSSGDRWLLATLCIAFAGCSSNQGNEEARVRELDSLRELVVRDSAVHAHFHESLSEALHLLDQPPIDSLGGDCIRIIVEFAWDNNTVGPAMSMLLRKGHQGCDLSITAFPGLKRVEMVSMKLGQNEFARISALLDSVKFNSMPVFETAESNSTDPNYYFVERLRGEDYHGISRSQVVDAFIFKAVGDISELAGLQKNFVDQFRQWERAASTKK